MKETKTEAKAGPEKVKHLRAHIAVQLPGLTVTAVDAVKHGVEMLERHSGILIKKGSVRKVVTYANIQEYELFSEE